MFLSTDHKHMNVFAKNKAASKMFPVEMRSWSAQSSAHLSSSGVLIALFHSMTHGNNSATYWFGTPGMIPDSLKRDRRVIDKISLTSEQDKNLKIMYPQNYFSVHNTTYGIIFSYIRNYFSIHTEIFFLTYVIMFRTHEIIFRTYWL